MNAIIDIRIKLCDLSGEMDNTKSLALTISEAVEKGDCCGSEYMGAINILLARIFDHAKTARELSERMEKAEAGEGKGEE